MARVVITEPADADSAVIISDLTAKAGELVADRYEADFDALYRRLETFPESGSPRPKLGRLIRIGVVSPYVMIYASRCPTTIVLPSCAFFTGDAGSPAAR